MKLSDISQRDRAAILATVERYAPPQVRLALATARRLRIRRRLRSLRRLFGGGKKKP